MAFVSVIQYHQIWLAEFFHRFPHVNFSFSEIEDTFDPENHEYRTVLTFWAGIPLICCALLWLAFLIFFSVRFCLKKFHEEKENRPGSRKCTCFCAGLFLLLGCGALAASFYGNSQIHSGIDAFVHSLRNTNKTVKSSSFVLKGLEKTTRQIEEKRVPALMKAVSDISNNTVRTHCEHLIKSINTSMETAMEGMGPLWNFTSELKVEEVADKTSQFEQIRWALTILACCTYIFIFLLFFAGILRRSTRVIIVCAALSVFFLPAIWAVSSFHLASGVAAGDLCVDPNGFVMSKLNGTIDGNALVAYVECTDVKEPYQGNILTAQAAVTKAINALKTTVNISMPFNISKELAEPVTLIKGDLSSVFGNLSSLSSMVGSCETIHGQYEVAVHALCNSALYGIGYIVLFSELLGIFIAVVVFCSPSLWGYFIPRRVRGQGRNYRPTDDTDPFVPNVPPPSYGSTGSSGHNFGSGPVSINNEADVQVMDYSHWEDSPPPYRPSHLHEYATLAPTPNSIVQSTQ